MMHLTVIEHERIAIRSESEPSSLGKVLSERDVDELEALGARLGVRIVEPLSRKAVKFTQFVGIVRVGGRDIEVLPKLEDPALDPPVGVIRHNLLQMLLVAHDVPVTPAGNAATVSQYASWLDVFIQMFCSELASAARRGLPKRYRLCEENLLALQGRLLVHDQMRRSAAERAWLACEFDELDENHDLSQLLKLALQRMLTLSRSMATQRALRSLLVSFGAVADRSPAGDWWRHVRVDRLTADLGRSVQLAQLFLSGLSPGLTKGDRGAYALLFDMNRLFESYIARRLRSSLADSHFEVKLQSAKHHLVRAEGERTGLFRLRPDLVVMDGLAVACVGDTKWKRLAPEERKLGVSQTDLYQMLAYANRYACSKTWLIYPFNRNDSPSLAGGRRFFFENSEVTVLVGAVCLARLDTVDDQLRALFVRARVPDATPG